MFPMYSAIFCPCIRSPPCAGGGGSPHCGRIPVGGGSARAHGGLGAAFVAMPGHKGLYGPQGTGLLLCRELGEPPWPGDREPVPAAQYARFPARPGGGRDPQRPRGGGSAGGAAVSAPAGHPPLFRHETALIRQAAKGLGRMPRVQVYWAGEKGCQGAFSPSAWPGGTRVGWPTGWGSRGSPCGRGSIAPPGPRHRGHGGHRDRANERLGLQHRGEVERFLRAMEKLG